jgi:hypothetical protein
VASAPDPLPSQAGPEPARPRPPAGTAAARGGLASCAVAPLLAAVLAGYGLAIVAARWAYLRRRARWM